MNLKNFELNLLSFSLIVLILQNSNKLVLVSFKPEGTLILELLSKLLFTKVWIFYTKACNLCEPLFKNYPAKYNVLPSFTYFKPPDFEVLPFQNHLSYSLCQSRFE